MTFPIHLQELEERASESLPSMVYDYYAGGAHDEITLRENREAYQRLTLRYHVLRDVANRSLETEVLAQRISMRSSSPLPRSIRWPPSKGKWLRRKPPLARER
jgi:4-hydroxymandelate oxidase